MTRAEFEARLRERETQYGLAPGELRALWQQESGGSLDPGLKGVPLSRGRGHAVGPMQIVPAYHPTISAATPIQEQLDYAAGFYAKGGPTQAERLASYYGKGAAPAGHPTTDQYVAQVQARIPDLQALNTPAPAIPEGNPMPTFDQNRFDELEELRRRQQQQQAYPRYADYVPEQQAPAEPSMWDKAMTNPLTQMGAAIMAASGTDWGRPLGAGIMAANNAVHNRRLAETELMELQQRRADQRYRAAREQRKYEQEDTGYNELQSLANRYEASGNPMAAAQIRSGVLKTVNQASYGTTPHYERDPKTGAVSVVRYASDGTKTTEPAAGTPFAVESKLPGFQGQVSEAKAGGAETGKANATSAINAPTEITKADQAMAVIDRAMGHPGLDRAVGLISLAPTLPGSAAADYESVLGQIKGGAFLQAFRDLKGGGAITEIEGEKATQAITSLNTKQSPEEHRRALADLKEIVTKARAKTAAGVRTQNPYGGQQPAAPAAGGWSIERGR